MNFLIDFTNFLLLGVIFSLTIRWCILKYNAFCLKAARNEPLDRMILISSIDILKGVIRKRNSKAGWIVRSIFNENKGLDKQTEIILDSVYDSLAKQNLKFFLIPNEDIHIAKKKGMLDEPSKFFFNEEIIVRLSEREKKQIVRKKIEKDLLAKKRAEEETKQMIEQQKRQKEKELEDKINI